MRNSYASVCVGACEYLDVLHHVPQLHQELFGLGGSVRKAVESLRQLTLHRGHRTACYRCRTAVKLIVISVGYTHQQDTNNTSEQQRHTDLEISSGNNAVFPFTRV